MQRRLAQCAAMVLVAACYSPTEPPAIVDYNVLVQTAEAQGEVSFAGVTMRAFALNTGVYSVFVARCGDGPLVLVEQFVDGAWQEGPTPDCAPTTASGPIELASGATISADRAFAEIGRYRMSVTVDTTSAMATAVRVRSLRFDLD